MDIQEYPFVSIVMPIRNEAGFIGRTIRSIQENDYPHDRLEVLVADGMSTDATREVVGELASADPRIRLIDNTGRIVSTGLNEALRQSRGEVFIRIDGHCEIPPHFIRTSVETLLSRSDAWVAGGYWKTVSEGVVGRTIASATESPVGVGNARHRLGGYDGWVDTLPYGAHHRWILDRIGYFDEQLVRNQDDEFNMRIHLAGGRIWLSSEIWSVYYARSTLSKLWRQYFQYGFWRVRTMQKHRRAATWRQLAPSLLVLSLLGLSLLGLVWSGFWWLLAAEAALYLLGLLYGAIAVMRREGVLCALLAPLVFVILHFGYGLGCMWGLVRFILLRGKGLPQPESFALSR